MADKTYTKEQLLEIFVAGFLAAGEGNNGECNECVEPRLSGPYTPAELLKVDRAKLQFQRDFDYWVEPILSHSSDSN